MYHVSNRGNGGAVVFRDTADFDAFVELLGGACVRVPVRVLAFCVLPDHFHLVLWPQADGDLSRWMRWLLTAHVRRHHARYRTSGHLWQGRFRAFPVAQDGYLLDVLRYVEGHARRAGLVEKAEAWAWSSLRWRTSFTRPTWLHDGPLQLPRDWVRHVNRPASAEELAPWQRCLRRGAPFGPDAWVARMAERLGLESTLRPRGRPPKSAAR